MVDAEACMGRVTKRQHLHAKQQLALVSLVKGRPVKDVARDLSITPDTIYAWRKSEAWQTMERDYISSLAREELDRGLQDAQIDLNQSAGAIVKWMTGVVLGEIELKPQDQKRWRMALDLLHHAGILDKQAALRAEQIASNHPQTNVSLTLDQRRQQMLAPGNAELARQLENFRPPGS